MRSTTATLLALALAAACASTKPQPAQPAASAQAHVKKGLHIRLTTIYVDDQDKALRFYTDVLGFAKKDDISNGGFRWLSVTDGSNDLQLALNDNPAAKAFQQAMFQQSQPAVMFYTDDIAAEVARIKTAGGELTMPPTDVTMATIAMLKDTAGNLVQITQLSR